MDNNYDTKECRVKCTVIEITPKELYEFNNIIKAGGFKTEVSTTIADEDDLGIISFSEFVLLIPLVSVAIVQFRKLIEAYWKYHRQRNKSGKIVFKQNDKKLTIEFENEDLPSIEDFMLFFDPKEENDRFITVNEEDLDA